VHAPEERYAREFESFISLLWSSGDFFGFIYYYHFAPPELEDFAFNNRMYWRAL
jgi:hypothetical protein